MQYTELFNYVKNAAHIREINGDVTLTDMVGMLRHSPDLLTRAIAAETIARFLAEFVDVNMTPPPVGTVVQ